MDWVYPHLARLRKMLRRHGRTRDECDDILQDLFVRLLSHCQSAEEIREPERFLANVVRNLSTDAFRREHRELYAAHPVEDLAIADIQFAPEELASCDESLES